MKNKEKYFNELMDFALTFRYWGVDKENMEIALCGKIACDFCLFGEGVRETVVCTKARLDWLNAECVEPKPETDWSKVEVDTPILVRVRKTDPWEIRYFAKYEDGKVWCWDNGRTSYTANISYSVNKTCSWKLAKLPTPEELERYRKKA